MIKLRKLHPNYVSTISQVFKSEAYYDSHVIFQEYSWRKRYQNLKRIWFPLCVAWFLIGIMTGMAVDEIRRALYH